jgi:hypothetical protein
VVPRQLLSSPTTDAVTVEYESDVLHTPNRSTNCRDGGSEKNVEYCANVTPGGEVRLRLVGCVPMRFANSARLLSFFQFSVTPILFIDVVLVFCPKETKFAVFVAGGCIQ